MGSNQKTIIIAAVVLGVVGLGLIFYLNVRPVPEISGVVQYPRPPRGHDNSVDYEGLPIPPAGGIHFDIWQNCGRYDEPVASGNAIHSMEHGAVWIAYQEDLPSAQVAALAERVDGDSFLLMAPYTDLESPVVLTAWGLQLSLDDATDRRVDQFIERYRLGSQTPEPGATCEQGVGTPILAQGG